LASRSRDFPRSRHHQAATHRILRERRRVDPAAYRQPAAELAALSRRHCRRMLLPEAFLDRHERHQARPDQFIFDFDPAPGLPFTAVVDAAKTMRDYLAAMKIESFCKTTGGKGLHVVAPLKRDIDWAELKAITKKIASNFATAAPDRFTINPLKRERNDRIFLDYLRNDRGSTAVAPYVVRARPGATISLPLDWNEVNARLDPSRYTLASVPKLLAKRKDPWAGMTKHRQTIAAAQRALGLAA